MKVLHVITDLYTGGAEHALINLLSSGLAHRFDTHVLNLREETRLSQKISDMGIPVINLGMNSAFSAPGALLKLHKIIKALKPDVIQGWMYHGNLATALALTGQATKPVLIWNIRQSLYSIDNEKLNTRQVIRANRWLSLRPQAIIYNSKNSKAQHECFGLSSSSSRVIPNGINVNEYQIKEESQARIRSEFGIGPNAVVVGHIARLHPVKNHKGFICAAVALASKHESVEFILVGSDVTESNLSLTSLVPDTLLPRFHFVGERHDIPELMNAMDIFCLSSFAEAFPNVLGEAMASGLPCVATDVGDCADILGTTGTVVKAGDDQAMAEALQAMIAMPLSERKKLGALARSRIEQNFVLENVVKQYIDLYESFEDTAGKR